MTLTKGSGDGGIDVIVMSTTKTYLIQSKGWHSRVGVSVVREMAGVTAHTQLPNPIGVVLATGGFTAEAQKFASSAGILLWEAKTLAMLSKHEITLD